MDAEIKVKFPKKFCDYWWENPKTWTNKRPEKCDFCPNPISKGEEYFEISVSEDEVIRGHLHHLEVAEPVEWIPEETTQ